MNLALVGYGKMGRLIEQLAPEYGFQVAVKLDGKNNGQSQGITREAFGEVDAAVEFSMPAATVANIERLAEVGVDVVVGTTGWHDRLDHVRSVVERGGIGLVWSPNYSVGVQAFLQIVAQAARVLAKESEYGAWAWEIHHAAKKDALSGTLLKLVEEMKKSGYSREVSVSASRAGGHPGTHEVGFDSAADTITLRHAARSREGFARGALRAAQWVVGKKGIFEFRDILKELG